MDESIPKPLNSSRVVYTLITLLFGVTAPVIVYLFLVVFHNALLAFAALYLGGYALISALDLSLSERKTLRKGQIQRERATLGETARSLGLKFSWKAVITGLISGISFGAITFVFFTLFRGYIFREDILGPVLADWSISIREVVPIFLILVVFNPLFEEFYWRGYFFRRLQRSFNIHISILISSFFYASYHFITTGFLFSFKMGTLLTAGVFCVGIIWGYMRSKTQSLVSSVISHLFSDAGIVLAFVLYLVPVLKE